VPTRASVSSLQPSSRGRRRSPGRQIAPLGRATAALATAPGRAAWWLPVVIVAVVAAPLLTDRTFAGDWSNHLWLVWQQSQSIAQLGHPSYFLDSQRGVFEPFYAFYGGSFYSVTGGLAALLGRPVVAFCMIIALAFAAAYVGWSWLAHQLGIRGWLAHIPGLLYVTAPFVITDAFSRGDIPETVAPAAIPLVAASGLALLRAERVRVGPAAVLVVSVAWMTGTHTITTLWGTTFLAATAVVLFVAAGHHRPRAGRVATVLGLAALGAAINSWFLLPELAYAGTTPISHSVVFATSVDAWRIVFDPLRSEATDSGSAINVQTPVLAAVWALLVLAAAWRRLGPSRRRLAIGMGVIAVALLALILTNMSIVPKPWSAIQIPYRAQTYVTLAVIALVLVAIDALRSLGSRTDRVVATVMLALVAAINLGQAIDQEWSQPSTLPTRSAVFRPNNQLPPAWNAGFDYADASLPVVPVSALAAVSGPKITAADGVPVLAVPVDGHADSATLRFVSPGPRPVAVDVYGGPYLVGVSGARVIGRTKGEELVVEPTAPAGKPAVVTFSVAHSAPVVLGIIVTLAATLLALMLLALAVTRRTRGRSRKVVRAG